MYMYNVWHLCFRDVTVRCVQCNQQDIIVLVVEQIFVPVMLTAASDYCCDENARMRAAHIAIFMA